MGMLAVLLAAAAGFATGAVWYMALGKRWMAAVGKTEEEIKANQNPLPFIVAIVGNILVARDGTISANGDPIGQIAVVNAPRELISRFGDTAFTVEDDAFEYIVERIVAASDAPDMPRRPRGFAP